MPNNQPTNENEEELNDEEEVAEGDKGEVSEKELSKSQRRHNTVQVGGETNPAISELSANVGALIELVKAGQVQNEEMRSKIEAMQIQHEKDLEQLTETIESTGDKGRVQNWRLKNAKLGPREYKICGYNGKVVLSWDKMKSNLVYKNELKATVENLVSTLHFADGTQEDVLYTKWQMERVSVPAVYQGEEIKVNEFGEESKIIKLKLLDSKEANALHLSPGKEYAIELKFLN